MPRLLPLLLLASLAVSAASCRRRSQPATTPPSSSEVPALPATNPSGAPAPAVSANAPAASNPPAAEVDRLPTAPPGSSRALPINQPLTEALQRHLEATGKFPSDFNALVTGKYISSLPQPPAGKRFAVDRANLQVVVVGQ